jgi:uncharacterized protein (DUF1778 family)
MSEFKAEVEQPEPPTSMPRNNGRCRCRRMDYTEQEYELIEEAAKMSGKPIGDFIREESLAVQFKAQPFLRDAELRRELGENRMTLTRLAATARETGALPVGDELERVLEELRALIRQIAPAGPASTR